MEASRPEEFCDDNNVIIVIPDKNMERRRESENRAMSSDTTMDDGPKAEAWASKTEVVANLRDKSLESKNLSEATELLDCSISKINSYLFRTIVRLAIRYGNERCVVDTYQYLSLKIDTEGYGPESGFDDEFVSQIDSILFRAILRLVNKYGNIEGVKETFQFLATKNKNEEYEIEDLDDDIDSNIKSPLLRTIFRLAYRYGNDICLDQLPKFMSSESESEDDGIQEGPEPRFDDDDEGMSKIKSTLLRSIVRIISLYGNDDCINELSQFLIFQNETAIDEIADTKLGLAESIRAYGHYKNHSKLLIRDFRKANYQNYNDFIEYWKHLLENDNLGQKTPLGLTMLHIAAENGGELLVEEIVRQAPHLLTSKSLNGDTPLHVAAKAGHFSALKKLIDAHFQHSDNQVDDEALEVILERNKQGNTFFHEALIHGKQEVLRFLLDSHDDDGKLKEVAKRAALSVTRNEKKSGVYLAIEAGYMDLVQQAFNEVIPKHPKYVPEGKSLLLAAIIKQDEDIIDIILTRKPEWIHLMDGEERIPLHHAASIGYSKGIHYLLKKCVSCVMERDMYGFYPIHLASYAGHVKVVQQLLNSECGADPKDILDKCGRNILHLAVESGNLDMVKYIMEFSNIGLQSIINEQDRNGNTPLHLATLCCHPKIVHALTWDKSLSLNLVNSKGQTALDAFEPREYLSRKQRLTRMALISAGVQTAEHKSSPTKVPPRSTDKFLQQVAPKMDHYKKRIDTLMLVSTLIITITFASGFTMPGGTKSSGDPGQGTAVMLQYIWFKLFVFCITISMYGAITVTIILIWAQLGDITWAFFTLKVASFLLGITLAALSLAFFAAVHLVIMDLSWLATTSLAMGLFFIYILLLLYTANWFPSSSRNLVVRYISYYPFLLLASLVDHDED